MDQETADEIKRHFNVVGEGLRSDIRALAEGLGANTDRVDHLEMRFDGFEGRFEGLRSDIRALAEGLGANTDRLDRLELRFDGFEGRFDGFEGRFDGFEGRFDGFENRVTSEFTETRAMIRLSYGELERRIVRLEGRGV